MASRLRYVALLALIAGVYLSCNTKDTPPPPEPPAAPNNLNLVGTWDDSLRFNWHLASADENGFYFYWLVNSAWQRIDTFPPSALENVYGTVTGLLPGSDYRFRVTAFNEIGESDSSNEVQAQTSGTLPPEPPVNIHAQVLSPNVVQVGWTPVGTSDGFRISRRQASTGWIDLQTVGSADTTYTDSLAAALTTYYYRVGSIRSTLISWSADSAVVTTPDGPPLPPDSVLVQSFPGLGIRVTWADHSENELGFRIGRSTNGQAFQVIDSVGANVTTYFDSLGNFTGSYTYRVQAYNAIGASNWAYGSPFNYDLCSDGVIPLCLGNWWQYTVYDSAGSDYSFRRYIRNVQLIGGLDYYLTTAVKQPELDPQDSLYYLRNFDDGCHLIHHPLELDSTSQLLFRYPSGSFYYVDGDCVIVSPAGNLEVEGVIYTDVYFYQRFFSSTHSLQIFVDPISVGVIREREYVNSNLVARRDLTGYFVQNN